MSNFIDDKIENFDKVVFYACVIDAFFLPYVWFISIPYTMPLIFYWAIKRNKQISMTKDFKLFIIMLTIMCFSTILSFLWAPQYSYKNSVLLIQFVTMFLYYFLFSYYINRYYFNVKKYLVFFILFVLVLAVIYNIDKYLYHSIKLFWNQRSGVSINENLYEGFAGYRYAFVWMDANNIAYMMNAIVLYLWCNEKTSFFIKILSLLSLVFILIACMSNGGFITFFIIIGLYFSMGILKLFKGKFNINFRIRPVNVVLLLATIAILLYISPKVPSYLQTNIVDESLERIESNSAEPRFIIWEYVIENVNVYEYIFFGKGGVTLVNNFKFSPHNGHFYWILAYGIIAYFLFMYIIFRKRKVTPLKDYIWVFPILLGFTVNVLLGEIKLMGIFLLLVACSSSPLYLKNVMRGDKKNV